MAIGNKLEVEQERLQKALEAAGVGTWDYDLVSQQLIWSPRSRQLFGVCLPRPDNNETFMDCLHPEDRELVAQSIKEAMDPRNGGNYDLAYRVIGIDDQQQRWLKANGRVYFDDAGKPYRFIGTLIDITQQKKTELKLAESEQHFRRMADSSPVMLWITDAEGKCTYLNKRWIEFTGQPLEEGLGHGWTEVVHPEDRPHTVKQFEKAIQTHSAFQMDYRLRTANGDYRWTYDTALPRFDEKENFIGYFGSVVDISDRKKVEEELQFRTALLEAQNESSSNGLLTVDTKGKMLSYNLRFAELWNMPQQIIDDKNDHAALEHAMTQLLDPEEFIQRVNFLYQNPGKTAVDEILFKDGRILERTGLPVTGKDGTYYGWLWQFQDVTERRAVQKELELRTALLEAQHEATPLGLLVINQDKEVQFMNRQFIELFRLPDELVTEPNREALLVHMQQNISDYDAFMARISHLYAEGQSGSKDELRMVDGRIIERFGFPIRGRDGRSLGWTWQFWEITDERMIEERLQQKNDALQSLIQEFKFVTDFMPQMVWATQADGYHDFFNQQWYDYTGLTYDVTKDKGWSLVLHHDDVERTWKIWTHSLQTGDVYEIEYRMRRFDGEYRWFLGRAIPMRNAEGVILKWFGTCTDIHDQRMASDLLEQKVAERTREIQEINKNLERSNQELEQFAYVASHDLQEPVRKIRTFTTMLEKELDQPDQGKTKYYVDRIWHSSMRMQELIKDLLNFSRLNRNMQNAFEPIELGEIVQQIAEDLDLLITQKHAEINWSKLPTIQASPLQMSQLFYNLLSNALKFSRPEVAPKINISSSYATSQEILNCKLDPQKAPYIHLTISDNGIGFDPQYAQQIFTIFQRLHTRAAYEGTGIGLALCKKVATNHHGEIYAHSTPGEGSVFHILLPIGDSIN